MKKLAIVLSLSVSLGACSTTSHVLEATPDNGCVYPGTKESAPNWICTGEQDGVDIAAVGISEPSKRGVAFMRDMATLDARAQIAEFLSSKTSSLAKAHGASAGMSTSEAVDAFSETAKKSFATAKLNGAKVYDFRIASTGQAYVLVGIDAQKARLLMKKAVLSSSGNNEALWQKIQADKAFKELDAEVEKIEGY